jgi:hypothetical protein
VRLIEAGAQKSVDLDISGISVANSEGKVQTERVCLIQVLCVFVYMLMCRYVYVCVYHTCMCVCV